MINQIKKSVLTMMGIGYFPYFPGTVASFLTCIIFYFLWAFIGIKNLILPFFFFLIILSIYSVILINKFYKKEDAKEIVVDEFIGQSIPLLAFLNTDLHLRLHYFLLNTPFDLYVTEIWILLSFILFRFFDIFKPFPINLIDLKIKNGFGVVLDDIVAGILATISIYILLLWI